MRNFLRRIMYGHKADSDTYIKHLRSIGMRIGARTRFFEPRSVLIDETRPYLIEIGEDVQITHGVIMLTHGYDWSVLKGKYGVVYGSSGAIKIGNNVFVGMNTIILKGVNIGNNVVIGAGSLVNKDVPDNCVVAGNPARVIMTLDEYLEKREKAQIKEAEELVCEYRNVYGKDPGEEDLSEFFWLFSDKKEDLTDSWSAKMQLVGNEEFSMKVFEEHKKQYENMKSFLEGV